MEHLETIFAKTFGLPIPIIALANSVTLKFFSPFSVLITKGELLYRSAYDIYLYITVKLTV